MDDTISTPKVSVVMCVRNGEQYLHESIQSVLNQTFGDFEFIIINDGSTDGTADVLNDFVARDARIRVIKNLRNMGIGYSRNKGNAAARGKYIAIMDADDYSCPERFAMQVEYLDKNPEIAVLGTTYLKTNSDNTKKLMERVDLPGFVRWLLIFYCALSHPSVMMRNSLFYEEGYRYLEDITAGVDFELFSRIVQNNKISNLDVLLHHYRWHEKNISIQNQQEQTDTINSVIRTQVNKYISENIPEGLMDGFKWPNSIQHLEDAQTIVGLYIKLLDETKNWGLNKDESAAILHDFLTKLKTAAKAVHKHPFILVRGRLWKLYLKRYIQLKIFNWFKSH